MTTPTNDKRRCYNCKFYYRHDRGYSNYTVEDTEVNCLLRKNPHLDDTSEGYSWETDDHEFMRVAEGCCDFVAGEPLTIDCDEESAPYDRPDDRNLASYYTQDHQVIAAFDAYENRARAAASNTPPTTSPQGE